MNKKFYTLRNDLVFKNVFLKDKKRIKWLLDGILNMNVEIYNISNCELYKDRLYIRSKTIDSIIDTNYAYFNIELNDTFNDNKKIRNFYYQTSYLNQLVHVKEDYVSMEKPIIQININVSNTNTLEIINKYSINDNITYDEYLNIFYIININIDKIIDKWYNKLNQDLDYFNKYKYLLIIGMDEEKLKNLEVNDDMIKEIKEDVITLNKNPEFYQVMTEKEDNRRMMNTMFKEGETLGYERGIEQGIVQEKITNARKMKKEKIPCETIQEITGLSLKTIKSL